MVKRETIVMIIHDHARNLDITDGITFRMS